MPEHSDHSRAAIPGAKGLSDDERVGPCWLCGATSKRDLGHIVPRFMFQWLRKNKGTRFLHGAEMHRPKQDGWKAYMLCRDHEQRFQGWETRFASTLLEPMQDYEDAAHYPLQHGAWLLPFCASLSWRTAEFRTRQWPSDQRAGFLADFGEGISAWKRFLLGDAHHCGEYRQHLVPAQALRVQPTCPQDAASRLYLEEAVDAVVPRPSRF